MEGSAKKTNSFVEDEYFFEALNLYPAQYKKSFHALDEVSEPKAVDVETKGSQYDTEELRNHSADQAPNYHYVNNEELEAAQLVEEDQNKAMFTKNELVKIINALAPGYYQISISSGGNLQLESSADEVSAASTVSTNVSNVGLRTALDDVSSKDVRTAQDPTELVNTARSASFAGQIGTALESTERVNTAREVASFVSQIGTALESSERVNTARSASFAGQVGTATELTDRVNTAREVPSAGQLRTASDEASNKEINTAVDLSEPLPGTAKSLSSTSGLGIIRSGLNPNERRSATNLQTAAQDNLEANVEVRTALGLDEVSGKDVETARSF